MPTRPSPIGATHGQTLSTTVTVTRPSAPEGALIAVWLDAILSAPGAEEAITPPAGFAEDLSPITQDFAQGNAFFKVAGASEPATYDFEYDINAGGVRWNVLTLANVGDELAAGEGTGFDVTYTVNGATAAPNSLQVIFVSASGAALPAGATEQTNEDGDTYTFTRPLDASTSDESYGQDGGTWMLMTFVWGPLPDAASGAAMLLA